MLKHYMLLSHPSLLPDFTLDNCAVIFHLFNLIAIGKRRSLAETSIMSNKKYIFCLTLFSRKTETAQFLLSLGIPCQAEFMYIWPIRQRTCFHYLIGKWSFPWKSQESKMRLEGQDWSVLMCNPQYVLYT